MDFPGHNGNSLTQEALYLVSHPYQTWVVFACCKLIIDVMVRRQWGSKRVSGTGGRALMRNIGVRIKEDLRASLPFFTM
jgi:hypothetical protein